MCFHKKSILSKKSKIQTFKKQKEYFKSSMNQKQVQVIRGLKQRIVSTLVKLVDICPQFSIEIEEPISILKKLDATFRGIYSNSDPEGKLDILKKYFADDFIHVLNWKNSALPKFEAASKKIKTETIEQLKKNNLINDAITERLKELDVFESPFSNDYDKPFNYDIFIASLPIEGKTNFLDPIFRQANYYKVFFIFSLEIKWMEQYREKLETNDIPVEDTFTPSSITLPSVSSRDSSLVISPRDENSNLPRIINMDSSKDLQNWGMRKIENDPLLHKNEKNPGKEGRHHGVLNLGGLIWPQNDPKRSNRRRPVPTPNKNNNCVNSNKVEDPDTQFVSDYNAFILQIEENSKNNMSIKERIQARMEQKVMILQHEGQILRENLFIMSKQKEELISIYESYIKEVLKQNEKLTEENDRLRKDIEEKGKNSSDKGKQPTNTSS
ncbi:hypothetical protein TRFO_17075 [Tritrichomonas foetus]|uniref:Uncharacterized protein n=1 Tax=Tritrichomonas foetus TaxID=1144522 RepID=A0A1J4KPU7_9EUKA|nr:hypothetical protein TRFO_17075 [Tritrichomonas foetus]|eukprot:OHT12920.1 hypothetical protein TRFO_17075 [Tritrichomonas foetus]